MTARIVVESGIDKGLEFDIKEGKTSLGRSAHNAIQIIDKRMSRHHIELEKEGAQLALLDLGSKNGTFLNNQKITGRHVLNNSDRIRIGETVLLVEKPDEEEVGHSSSKDVKYEDPRWLDSAAQNKTMVAGANPLSLTSSAEKEDFKKKVADQNKQLEIIYMVADAIRTIFDLEELLERIMEIIWESLDPDSAVILLVDEKSNQLYPVTSRISNRDESGIATGWETPEEGVKVSRSIINRSMNDRVSVLMADQEDQRFGASESVIMNKINSAICSPLINQDEILGVVYVDSNSRFSSYSDDQQALLTGISNQAAMAIANVQLHKKVVAQQKFEKEMEIARTIQMNLHPKVSPDFENFEIAALSFSAKHVGGDYYDYVEMDNNRWGIAIADVSGKGVPAALLTTTVRAAMLSYAERAELTPPELMANLNRVTFRDSLNNMFVTMVYAIIDDNNRTVQFTNAGHAHPFIIHPDKSEVSLIEGGCFLGIDDQMEYEVGETTMKPGSVLVLYTDGVPDATNEEKQQFGLERFKTVVRDQLENSSQDILDNIYQATLSFRGTAEQFDDFTLIILKCLK